MTRSHLLSSTLAGLGVLGFLAAVFADFSGKESGSLTRCLEHDLEANFAELDAAGPVAVQGSPAAESKPAATLTKGDAPAASLLIVGPKLGTMEPCGCTGGQLGGLAKLKTQLDLVCQADPGAVLIDCGGLTKGNSAMELIRGEIMAGIYQLLPNSVVALGPADLASGANEADLRAQIMQDASLTTRFPNASQANVATGFDGVTHVVGSAIVASKSKSGAVSRVLVASVIPDAAGPGKCVKALRDEFARQAGKFDLFVAVFHGQAEEARALGAAVPELDFILVGEGVGTPDDKPQLVGSTLYMHPGQKGRHVVHLTLSRSGGAPVFSALSIDVIQTNIPADPTALERVNAYRAKLAEKEIVKSLAGKRPKPSMGYAGSAACQECHKSAYAVWETSKHAHAVENMVARQGDKDPDCLKCHAVGWYSEPPAGEIQAYKGDDVKSRFANVGCESCHGPAFTHTKTPYTIKPVRDVTCQKCHDVENSPDFDRAKYWPKIFHEKDKK